MQALLLDREKDLARELEMLAEDHGGGREGENSEEEQEGIGGEEEAEGVGGL